MIEMVTNDRVVGGITRRCAEKAAAIYRVFAQGEILLTDAASAEMAKLIENAYRDVNIAFANELSLICETLQLDVWEVIQLANHHPRVNILSPGPGVGGHCIAVDPWFIVGAAPELSPADPHGPRGQRPQAAPRRRSRSIAKADAVPRPDGRLPRPDLQGQRRRPAREPGRRHRRATSPQALPDLEILRRRAVHRRAAAELAGLPNVRLQSRRRGRRRRRHRRAARRPRPVPVAEPQPAGRQGRLRHPRHLALSDPDRAATHRQDR